MKRLIVASKRRVGTSGAGTVVVIVAIGVVGHCRYSNRTRRASRSRSSRAGCLSVEEELDGHLIERVGQVDRQRRHVQLKVVDDGYAAYGRSFLEVDADHGTAAIRQVATVGGVIGIVVVGCRVGVFEAEAAVEEALEDEEAALGVLEGWFCQLGEVLHFAGLYFEGVLDTVKLLLVADFGVEDVFHEELGAACLAVVIVQLPLGVLEPDLVAAANLVVENGLLGLLVQVDYGLRGGAFACLGKKGVNIVCQSGFGKDLLFNIA